MISCNLKVKGVVIIWKTSFYSPQHHFIHLTFCDSKLSNLEILSISNTVVLGIIDQTCTILS